MNGNQFGSIRKITFLEQLKLAYSFIKNRQSQNSQALNASTLKNKQYKQRQQATRSKSKKRKKSVEYIRKSLRTNRQRNEDNLIQLQKEPLWKPRKIRPDISKQRKDEMPEIKKANMRGQRKIAISDPLYEFYSQYQPINNNNSIQQIDQLKQSNIQESTRRMGQQQNYDEQQKLNCNSMMEKINENNEQKQPQKGKQQLWKLQDWSPNKKQKSLLAIQKLIDQYFLFRSSMRNSSTCRFADIVNFVRDVKGYYFNVQIINEIMSFNSQLYTLITQDQCRYLKCPKLTPQIIENRSLSTKLQMSKACNMIV